MLKKLKTRILPTVALLTMTMSTKVFAAENSGLSINLGGEWSDSINAMVILTLLMLAPFILMVCTSFPRYIMSLSFLRQSMGLQQIPSNQVLVGVAFFMTMFTMQPTFDNIVENAYKPYTEEQITSKEMFSRTVDITKDFMLENTREKDLLLFAEKSGMETLPDSKADLDFRVVAPAFLISEFTKVFWVGLLLYASFTIIDIFVSTVLMSMGMMMLPPANISILIKLIVFLSADGWYNIIKALMESF